MGKDKTIAAFFAGIGGIEEGFHRENAKTVFFCEKDERAKAVLAKHYPGVPIGKRNPYFSKNIRVGFAFPCGREMNFSNIFFSCGLPYSLVVHKLPEPWKA